MPINNHISWRNGEVSIVSHNTDNACVNTIAFTKQEAEVFVTEFLKACQDAFPPSEGNVVVFDGVTTNPIPSDRILRAALEAKVTDVIVLGYDDKDEFYVAVAEDNMAENLFLAQRFIHKMMCVCEGPQ